MPHYSIDTDTAHSPVIDAKTANLPSEATFVTQGKKIMKSAVLTLLMSCFSLLAAFPASAQGTFGPLAIDSCTDYVARAMSQVQMGTGCNFQGPQWSPHATEHMNWCDDASPRDRGHEYNERRKALVVCRGDVSAIPISNCNDYASRVRSQVELAQALGSSCSFQGMRWSSNLVQHMNWCNRTDTDAHEFEDAARRKQLADCNAGRGKE